MRRLIQRLSGPALRKTQREQTQSKLRDLALWRLETNRLGHVAVAGMDVVSLVEKFGSPLLVVNRRQLLEDATQALDALSAGPPGSQVLYSYKTNCIPGILQEIHKLGIGAEVISPYELWLAERLGVPGDMIVYNGVNKTEESLERAARMDILSVNIDHQEEIERIHAIAKKLGRRIRVGLRLGLIPGSQFGLEIETGAALKALRKILSRSDRLQFTGIHFNVTSNAKNASTHKSCARRAVEFIASVREESKLTFDYLDIGGGFGVPTTKNMTPLEYGIYRTLGILPKPPDPAEFQPLDLFLKEIILEIKESCRSKGVEVPKILIEPGRFITSRAEFLLTKVLALKQKANGTRFAIADAGRLSLTFPTDFEYHEVFAAIRPGAPLTTNYQVMGRICTSADWMFKNRVLPELAPGDILAVMDAGAYFSSYATNFAFPRPPIVMVSEGEAKVIRREETFEHLTGMDNY
jgi:diaminopimelate decarboxylase